MSQELRGRSPKAREPTGWISAFPIDRHLHCTYIHIHTAPAHSGTHGLSHKLPCILTYEYTQMHTYTHVHTLSHRLLFILTYEHTQMHTHACTHMGCAHT